jgi:hypothetical protein
VTCENNQTRKEDHNDSGGPTDIPVLRIGPQTGFKWETANYFSVGCPLSLRATSRKSIGESLLLHKPQRHAYHLQPSNSLFAMHTAVDLGAVVTAQPNTSKVVTWMAAI